MKQKTAMQELVDYMKANFHLTDESLEKFDELLEKEKEQIMNAFDTSQMHEWTDEGGLTYLEYFASAEHYYKWKYKQN